MASIKLKHALGNSTILNSPASNPTNDVTLKLPSTTGSAGQVLQVASANHSATNAELEFAAAAGGGKLLQFKYQVKNDGASLSTATTPAEISSDFRTTITPTSGSSLIIITATLFISKTDEQNVGFRLYKSSSTDMSSPSFVQTPSTINSSQDGNLNIVSGPSINVAAVIKVVELAANTNARTYSPFWCQTGNPVNTRAYLNSYSGGGYFGTSTITVEEVEL